MLKKLTPVVPALALVTAGPTSADAAILAVDSITTTTVGATVDFAGNLQVDSLTIDGQTLTDLTLPAVTTGGTAVYIRAEDDPFNSTPSSAAVRGDQLEDGFITTGVSNVSNGSVFQFGRDITDDDFIVFTDFTNNTSTNSPTIQLVDVSGNTVGNAVQLNVFGGPLVSFVAEAVNSSGTVTQTFSSANVRGTSAQLTDFGVELTEATPTGFVVINNNSSDPFYVSLAAVPEPGSLVLAGFGSLLILARRRG